MCKKQFQEASAIPPQQIIPEIRMTKERQQFYRQLISESLLTSVHKKSVIEMIPKVR